jgi:hypothetical protein
LSLVSVIIVTVLLIYGNTMKFFDILQKIVSLLVAGTYVFFAIYSFTQWISTGYNDPVYKIFSLIAWLVISMGLIWFSEDVSEWLENRPGKDTSDWAPPGLVRFAGWVMLLLPAIIHILDHYKVFALLLR